jgi:hypothetical protein
MEFQGISGIDFYLANLERNLERVMQFDKFMKGSKKAIARSLK